MYRTGDIIKAPWGCGIILYSSGNEHYILWKDFNAHGFGAARYRLENAYSDEGDTEYWEKIGHSENIEAVLSDIDCAKNSGG